MEQKLDCSQNLATNPLQALSKTCPSTSLIPCAVNKIYITTTTKYRIMLDTYVTHLQGVPLGNVGSIERFTHAVDVGSIGTRHHKILLSVNDRYCHLSRGQMVLALLNNRRHPQPPLPFKSADPSAAHPEARPSGRNAVTFRHWLPTQLFLLHSSTTSRP